MGAEESRPAGVQGADADLLGGALKGWGVPTEWQGAAPRPTEADDDDAAASAGDDLRVSAGVLQQAGIEAPAQRKPEGRGRMRSAFEDAEQREARLAAERAARQKTRLDKERQRHKSPARTRASQGSTTPGSRYLSEGSDSEDEPVFVDGITAIQSAMGSSSYQTKIKDRYWELRERTDLACRGLQGNQVDTFFDKYERQDILKSERLLVCPRPPARALPCAHPACNLSWPGAGHGVSRSR